MANQDPVKAELKRLSDHILQTAAVTALRAAGGSVELLAPIMLAQGQVYLSPRGTVEPEFHDGDAICTAKQFVERLRVNPEYARCFKAAKESTSEPPLPTKNPWKKGTPDWNLTEQMRIQKSDPELARRLKSAAGLV